MRRLLCIVFGGHDLMRAHEGNRTFLRCSKCPYETPGVAVDGKAPRRRYDGDPKRHRMNRLTRVA